MTLNQIFYLSLRPVYKFTMLKRASYIFLCLAAMIIALHNVTPHFHQEPVASNSISVENQSVWDLLADAFDMDMGDGHLEFFSKHKVDFSEKITICGLLDIVPLVSWLDLSEKMGEVFSSDSFLYLADYQDFRFCLCQVDRGPPISA